MRALVEYYFVYLILVLIMGVALDAGTLDAKDYFIVGLPLSAVIAITAAVSLWRQRSQRGIAWVAAAKVAGLWLALLACYFALQFSSDRAELLRFVRVQWLMLPVVAVVGLIIAGALRRSYKGSTLSPTDREQRRSLVH
jgi:hypothetical protein